MAMQKKNAKKKKQVKQRQVKQRQVKQRQVDFGRYIKSPEERARHEQYKLYIAFSAIVLILVVLYQIIFGV